MSCPRQHRLVEPGGRPDEFIEDAYRLLNHPEVTVEIVVGDLETQSDHGALVALRGRFAVLARNSVDDLYLQQIAPTDAPQALSDQIPDLPPGPGPRSLTLPASALIHAATSAAEPGWTITALTAGGVRRNDARAVAEILNAPRLRVAQVAATWYHHHARKAHPLPPTLGVLDTPDGRYVTRTRGQHVLIAPGEPAHVHSGINELIQTAYAHRVNSDRRHISSTLGDRLINHPRKRMDMTR